MKLRNLIIVGIAALSATSCLSTPTETFHAGPETLEVSDTYWSELELIAGRILLSGEVEKIETRIPVDWAVGTEYAQIIGEVNLDEGHDPDFLRVIFTSDRVEWVGTNGSDYIVYEFEDECLEEGDHCDPVIPAEGVSGVFESTPGTYSAVVNTHCSTSVADYGYRVSAYVIDFSGKGLVRVSDIATLDIICEQM